MKETLYENAEADKNGDVRRIVWRIIITAAFAGCVLFIWHNSMEDAKISAERSGRVTEIVNEIMESLGQESVTEHFVRKLAHFSEYGLEGVFALLLFSAYCLDCGRCFWKIVLTGLVTALVDESIQFFSAGRAPGLLDVCIDVAGFLCGMLLMYIVRLLVGKACERWVQKKNGRRSFVN